MYLKVITGDTETAARRKYTEFLEQVNYDGALALLSGWSGIDLVSSIRISRSNTSRRMRYALSSSPSPKLIQTAGGR